MRRNQFITMLQLSLIVLLIAVVSFSVREGYFTGNIILSEIDPSATYASLNYSAPYDVFNDNMPIFEINPNWAVIEGEFLDLEVQVYHPGAYIWKKGYYRDSSSNKWVEFSFPQTALNNSWISEFAKVNLTINASKALKEGLENFVLTYSCKKINNQWKCGCNSPTETGICGKWMLQIFNVSFAPKLEPEEPPIGEEPEIVPEEAGFNLTKGLLAYYPFNGNANDASGKGFNGFLLGGVDCNTDGKIGKACFFDGIDDAILVNTTTLPETMTLALWLKFARVGGTPIPFSIDGNAFISGPNFFFSSLTIAWNTGDWFNNKLVSRNMDLEWHHYVLTNNLSTKAKLYVDGVFVGENVSQSSLGSKFYLGMWHSGAGYNFNGTMDEVAIYSRELNAEEIFQIYNKTTQLI